MFGNSLASHRSKILCIVSAVCVLLSVCKPTVCREISHTPVKPAERTPIRPTFTLYKNGEYTFDTGILRGKLAQGDKTTGLTSVVHIGSGAKLSGAYGICSYYRIFTTNKRYGTAAWERPGKSKLLPDGAVRIIWSEGNDWPFELVATYRWKTSSTLDIETVVKARKDLSKFEVFLASYFNETFSSPYVFVGNHPEAKEKPGFLLAKKSYGNWQMFPRSENDVGIIQDGRWQKEPHPIKWVIMPWMKRPIALRLSAKTGLKAVLMAPVEDCFAISTPYEGEGHYSTYLSLFGRDIKAGETARVRTRLIISTAISEQEIPDLYRQYMKDIAKNTDTGQPVLP